MIALTLAEVAAAVGGTLDGADPGALVTGPVEVDSRKVRPGGLFAAFVGERVDGHDYADVAVGAGAVAVLADRPVGVPAVLVDSVVDALGKLARAVVARAEGTAVVALTGSAGKTSTKDLIAQLLQRLGDTVYPPGSLNNEIGHPMTALRVEPGTRHLVMEMGARHKGDIEYLTSITPPRIGVVLNVGTAHVGEFGSQEAIAEAKGELVEALPADGAAILNADDRLVRAMAGRTRAKVVLFGESPDAHVRATNVRLDAAGRPSFTLTTPAGSAPVQLRLYGEHHVSNALAAAAVAVEPRDVRRRHRDRPGRSGCAVPLAHGGRRPGRWCHRRQRRLQREPRLDAGRAAGAGLDGGTRPGAPPHLGGARRDAGASARRAWPSTTPSGGSPSDWTSPSWWRSVDARRPAWNSARGTKVRGVRSRCWCPTRTRRSSCCAVNFGRGMWSW